MIDRGGSRKHACVIEQDDGSVLVRDLRSNNGTFVRGERAVEVVLLPGDEIVIGESKFSFYDDWDDSSPKSELDVRLASGPAVAPTMNRTMSDVDREEMMAQVQNARLAREQSANTLPPKARGGLRHFWKVHRRSPGDGARDDSSRAGGACE